MSIVVLPNVPAGQGEHLALPSEKKPRGHAKVDAEGETVLDGFADGEVETDAETDVDAETMTEIVFNAEADVDAETIDEIVFNAEADVDAETIDEIVFNAEADVDIDAVAERDGCAEKVAVTERGGRSETRGGGAMPLEMIKIRGRTASSVIFEGVRHGSAVNELAV